MILFYYLSEIIVNSIYWQEYQKSFAGSLLNLGFVQGVDQAKKELVKNGLEAVPFILLKMAWAGPRPIIILQAILQL